MKKATPYLFGVSAAGLTIMLAGTLSYILYPADGQGEDKLYVSPRLAEELANSVLQAKCADCHGDNPDYSGLANFLSGGLLKEDVENAQRAFTIQKDPTLRASHVDCLKMDFVLRTRCMPPARYSALHLGTRLTPEDITILRTYYPADKAKLYRFRPITGLADLVPAEELAPVRSGRPIEIAMKEGSVLLDEDYFKILLGHKLFFDTRLSTTDTVSCASCHDLTKGGTDNKPKSEGVPGPDGKPQLGGVNAPTVYNAAGNIRQFWDGRAATLAEQAGGPPLNPVEMGYSHPDDWSVIAAKLAEDKEIAGLFELVYGDPAITGERITDSIAAFEKCLQTPDSAFDAYIKGDDSALTAQQKAGLKAFYDHGCATCHSGPSLGGCSFEHINTFAPLRAHAEGYVEGAFGRADFTKDAKHQDMFRVPNLRNVALTAPYFHTGTVDKLEDAVRIMFQTQVGIEPSSAKVADVTAFLHAQTGKLGTKPLDQLTPEDVEPQPITTPAPKTDDKAPAQPEEPAVEPAPAQPEEPAVEPAPAQPEEPAVEPAPAQPEQPAVEPAPAQPEEPAVEPAPVQPEEPAAVEPAPVQQEEPVVVPAPVQPEEPAAVEPAPVQPEEPVVVPAPAQPEEPAVEPAPAQPEEPVIETTPVTEPPAAPEGPKHGKGRILFL